MAITTRAGAISGLQIPTYVAKALAGDSQATNRLITSWYATGWPTAATANAAGINGQAVSASTYPANCIQRNNPPSGNAYVSDLSLSQGVNGSNLPGVMYLCDRLWENSGLSVTSTTAQAITPATLPARDRLASTNGDNVWAGVEWSSAGGAGTPTVTLTYTNQAGTTGQSATFTGLTAPPAGTMEIFQLAAGDNGVRAPTSFIQSATRTSGTMHLVLFRVIAAVAMTIPGRQAQGDLFRLGFPKVLNDSCLFFLFRSNSTSQLPILTGQYQETWG